MENEKDKYGLFSPIGGKDIRQTYPELKQIKEFMDLSAKEFLFAWHYVFHFTKSNIPQDRLRIVKSIVESWGETMDIKEQEKYKNGNYPDKVRIAISKLESYELSARLKARFNAEKTMLDYHHVLSNTNMDDFTGEDKWDKMAKYIAITEKISENTPKLLKALEENFGISDSTMNKYREFNTSLLDEYHKNKKNN